MNIQDVEQRGNSLKAKLIVSNQHTYYSTNTSREFMISGATVFQVKVITTAQENLNTTNVSYNYLVFVRFTKRCAGDDLTYTIKFNSLGLKITNKCFVSDDGTWHLIYEIKMRPPFIFDVACDMEVMLRSFSFASLHDDTELTDVELRGKNGSVHIHRAVLAAASPVLRRMLSGIWRETAEGRVDVAGTSKATLQHMKDYLYLQTLPESGLEQLLVLSKYYMMPELEQGCVAKLVQSLSTVNAFDMIEFAVKQQAAHLLLAILECVQDGAVSIAEIRDLHKHIGSIQ